MKKVFMSALLAIGLVVCMTSAASATPSWTPPVDATAFTGVETGIGVAALASGVSAALPLGIAATAGAPLVYLIATQADPWHPLACALFGENARVGDETEAHCD